MKERLECMQFRKLHAVLWGGIRDSGKSRRCFALPPESRIPPLAHHSAIGETSRGAAILGFVLPTPIRFESPF